MPFHRECSLFPSSDVSDSATKLGEKKNPPRKTVARKTWRKSFGTLLVQTIIFLFLLHSSDCRLQINSSNKQIRSFKSIDLGKSTAAFCTIQVVSCIQTRAGSEGVKDDTLPAQNLLRRGETMGRGGRASSKPTHVIGEKLCVLDNSIYCYSKVNTSSSVTLK